jgi:hypothetical protein
MSLPACWNEVYKGDVTVHPFIIINNTTVNFTLHLHCIFYLMWGLVYLKNLSYKYPKFSMFVMVEMACK